MLDIAATSKRQAMSAAALQFAQQHRGATARTVAHLAPFIEARPSVENSAENSLRD
jgi:3-deoxy-D-manno-octulosonic-acid transferase